MNSKVLFSLAFALAFGISGAAHAQSDRDEWDNQELHSWEEAVDFRNLEGRDFESTSTVRLNFGSLRCVESIQVSAESVSGSGVLFVMGEGANNPDPLDQDIHAGTVTLPAARIDPNYPFRIDRRTKQVFLLVAGGTVRINRARAILIPEKMCPRIP